jgi:2-dehydro-3-deoxyphosphogluconate aldolase/(4S)-4-hydroxy-2-oxoglutarate aldolase
MAQGGVWGQKSPMERIQASLRDAFKFNSLKPTAKITMSLRDYPCGFGSSIFNFQLESGSRNPVIQRGMRAKSKILSDINYLGIVAVIRTNKAEQVLPVCEALILGGINILEVTMTVPDALNIMKSVIKNFGQHALVGMGSVLDSKSARAALEAGAEFIVSPIAKVEVAAAARAGQRVCMLGAYTPTETALAHDSGADFIKIFPADNLGPGYLRALRGPMPHLKLVPTGGITVENAAEFINAGAAALGIGSSLITKAILQQSDWTELTRLAAEYAQIIKTVREKK